MVSLPTVTAAAAPITPDTAIGIRPGENWSSDAVFFTYSGAPAEAIGSYECRLTRIPFQAGSFVPCPTEGKDFSRLADGPYRFEVRAISTDGTRDPTPADYTFTVDTIAPETLITAAPFGTIRVSTVSFAYRGEPVTDVAEIECRLARDGEPTPSFEICDLSGRTYTDLPDGGYTFEARARDAAGTVDRTPEARSFRIDTAAPETSIVAGPAGTVASSSVTFSYLAAPAEAGDRFACRMVGPDDPDPAFTTCASGGVRYDDLTDGEHRFEVWASDAAGNSDATPASRTFTVDTTAPATAIIHGPSGTVGPGDLTFMYEGTPADDVDRFECRLRTADDGDPRFERCPAEGRTYSDLPSGEYTFEVHAVDAVGNTGVPPAARTFRIEAPPVEQPPVEQPPVEQPPVAQPPVEQSPGTGPGPTPAGPAVGAPSAVTPKIGTLRLERTGFRAWKSGPAFGGAREMRGARGRGTWLRLQVDRAARVQLQVEARNKKRRWAAVRRADARDVPAGTTRIAVRGRAGGKTLRPGTYRLRATVLDPAGGAKQTKLLTFRITT